MEKRCKKCGKTFIPAYYHIFKDGKRFYCSWTCYNHRNDHKVKAEKKYKQVDMYDKSGELLKSFKSARDAADITGYDPDMIRDACRDGCVYKGFIWKYKE